MNDSDIANIIKDIEKQYNAYKDGGRSFIRIFFKGIVRCKSFWKAGLVF